MEGACAEGIFCNYVDDFVDVLMPSMWNLFHNNSLLVTQRFTVDRSRWPTKMWLSTRTGTHIHYRDLPICAKLRKHTEKSFVVRGRRRLGATQSWLCCVLYIGHTAKLFAVCFPRHTAIKASDGADGDGMGTDGAGRCFAVCRALGTQRSCVQMSQEYHFAVCLRKSFFCFWRIKVPIQTNIIYNIHNWHHTSQTS